MRVSSRFLRVLLIVVAVVPLSGATVSQQQAEMFARKMSRIAEPQGKGAKPGSRRTVLTETELNSWFAYRAQPILPTGVTAPQVSIIGNGKLAGQAVVDLQAVGKRRKTGGLLDPWSLLGGRLPVSVTGVLRTADGVGRFELESAEVGGVPVPKTVLQEIVGYYSRTDDHPQGIRLDDPFSLPANIRQIDVGTGQAVVVQ